MSSALLAVPYTQNWAHEVTPVMYIYVLTDQRAPLPSQSALYFDHPDSAVQWIWQGLFSEPSLVELEAGGHSEGSHVPPSTTPGRLGSLQQCQ